MRRKKYQESLLDKTDGQLAQLEQLASQVEFALVQKDVMYGLQQGTEVLQAIHKEMGGIEAVERLMGETEEARAYQEVGSSMLYLQWEITDRARFQEISQMLEGNLSTQDEEDVEDELEALQTQLAPKVSQPVLPNAPNNALPVSEDVEEEAPEQPRKTKNRTALAA